MRKAMVILLAIVAPVAILAMLWALLEKRNEKDLAKSQANKDASRGWTTGWGESEGAFKTEGEGEARALRVEAGAIGLRRVSIKRRAGAI